MSGAPKGAQRYVGASERSVWLCEGVGILGRRNHHVHGSTAYAMADAQWDAWRAAHPELEAKAKEMQAAAFDYCTTL